MRCWSSTWVTVEWDLLTSNLASILELVTAGLLGIVITIGVGVLGEGGATGGGRAAGRGLGHGGTFAAATALRAHCDCVCGLLNLRQDFLVVLRRRSEHSPVKRVSIPLRHDMMMYLFHHARSLSHQSTLRYATSKSDTANLWQFQNLPLFSFHSEKDVKHEWACKRMLR